MVRKSAAFAEPTRPVIPSRPLWCSQVRCQFRCQPPTDWPLIGPGAYCGSMIVYMDIPAHTVGYAIEAPSKPGDHDWYAVLQDLEWPSGTSTATDERKVIEDLRRRISATGP